MANSTAAFQHVHPHFNAEEAAHVAVDYIQSLDNLPGEVMFLLEEISEKERKMQSLRARIDQRHWGLTKNLKNTINTSSGSSGSSTPTAPFALPIPPGQPLPIGHLPAKDQQVMAKIQGEWAKMEQLQLEKIRLATRLEAIVSRARERGRAEWKKVGGMDLEEIESLEGRPGFGEMGGAEVLLPAGGLGPGQDTRPYKKRKPNALPLPLPGGLPTPTIIHPASSAMPPPPAPRPSLSARGASRHGRHVSTSTLSEDPDADGEVEMGEPDGDADETLYCFCQQKSYGEMIGCDNEDCEFEWFHVKCVNVVEGAVPETWYCDLCVQKLGLASNDGKKPGGRGQKARKK